MCRLSDVFFGNLKFQDNYPKVEYSWADFVQDTDTNLDCFGNRIFEIAGPKIPNFDPATSRITHAGYRSTAWLSHRRFSQGTAVWLIGSNDATTPSIRFRGAFRIEMHILSINRNTFARQRRL